MRDEQKQTSQDVCGEAMTSVVSGKQLLWDSRGDFGSLP